MENFQDNGPDFPVLKIAAYPFPKDIITDLTGRCEEVLVLEEGYPIVEEALRGILDKGLKVLGRLDGAVPRDGELNPTVVGQAVGIKQEPVLKVPSVVKSRPPSFCKGCSHSDTFYAVIDALKPFNCTGVFSDIGCYTLAAMPPYSIINSCVDMGASVTMAIGAADAGLHPSVAVIGDSTFTHSGMTGLLDAVIKNSPITIIISDNSTTGMTGGQKSHATGRLVKICEGLGVAPGHIREIIPLRKNHEENVRIMHEEFNYKGVSVIISARECIQTASRRKKAEASESN
jgi:indolepyruvate ferredoxin oxidoreductase alpha subunit